MEVIGAPPELAAKTPVLWVTPELALEDRLTTTALPGSALPKASFTCTVILFVAAELAVALVIAVLVMANAA